MKRLSPVFISNGSNEGVSKTLCIYPNAVTVEAGVLSGLNARHFRASWAQEHVTHELLALGHEKMLQRLFVNDYNQKGIF